MDFGASHLSVSMGLLGVFKRIGFLLNFKCFENSGSIIVQYTIKPTQELREFFQFQLGVHSDIRVSEGSVEQSCVDPLSPSEYQKMLFLPLHLLMQH